MTYDIDDLNKKAAAHGLTLHEESCPCNHLSSHEVFSWRTSDGRCIESIYGYSFPLNSREFWETSLAHAVTREAERKLKLERK